MARQQQLLFSEKLIGVERNGPVPADIIKAAKVAAALGILPLRGGSPAHAPDRGLPYPGIVGF